ncbi:MAG: hypothetical protein LBD23_15275 [Oscillospiraceae bacterium]|jgi:uncharacterized protein YPO0396|nr:hypothetical protein [Oscillospiraceae bacterium]
MKKLTKLLLVHWHYFTNELIEFDDINFLTGKNASGKSTIVDAMQLVLLGDTSGSYFNKAASGRGSRTLKGYLLGELGDDEDSGFRYLRGNSRFTSYIAMEFYDDEKTRFFTVGCCFDIYSENDITKLFFIYDGEIHPQKFKDGDIPMDITSLRIFLRDKYAGHHETTSVGRDFRTKLYGKLGGLRERFSGLLKRAVSFDPNVNIQQFISDFVCDEQQTVDVSHMQENIRSYKRLEAETEILHEKTALLEQVVKTHNTYIDAQKNEEMYAFLIDRALADVKSNEIQAEINIARELGKQLNELIAKLTKMDERLKGFREQRDTLNTEYNNKDLVHTIDQLDRQINEKRQRIQTLNDNYDRNVGSLITRIAKWCSLIEVLIQKINTTDADKLQSSISLRVYDIVEEGQNISGSIEEIGSIDADIIAEIGENGLSDLSMTIDSLKTHAIELGTRLGDEQKELAKNRENCKIEMQSLEEGFYRFPQDALDLKNAVSSRLRVLAKKDVNVRIVAEAAEIKNDRWRNAIEGYLHTQKFYIIVPDEYFKDAIHVLNTIKREKHVYGSGIIDIEKLRRLNPVANSGSLAEEIETADEDAKLFLDFTLGRVQKSERVQDLRRFNTSITDEGVLYQNFVIRAINPNRWSRPAIGQGAIERRLSAVRAEIELLTEQLGVCASLKTGLDATSEMEILSSSDIERSVSCARDMAFLPDLQTDLAILQENLAAIDTTSIDVLKERIASLDNDIFELDKEIRDESENKGDLERQQKNVLDKDIPKLESEQSDMESAIALKYEEKWINEVGILRYNKELSDRRSAEQVATAFPRMQSMKRNEKEAAWEELVDFRRSYNDKYKMGYDIRSVDNAVYNDAYNELIENKLPEYQTRIVDAKEKALEQFQEDFISRIQYNIATAKRQIDELNHAIKGTPFGEDVYHFRVIPEPEYKRFYNMIMDEMITEGGYTLLSLQFNEKYKNEITDLFAIITGDGSGDSSEYERRVSEFTDFRKYLYFDLEVTGYDNMTQRLSKTMNKKSGGETQTPFYIAVLASFAQLYRTQRDKSYNTSRLIIFDEAFSKMDGERIIKSVELLRKFDFQVILCAPPEKIDDISTLVDRNICVIREGTSISVGSFDPPEAEAL